MNDSGSTLDPSETSSAESSPASTSSVDTSTGSFGSGSTDEGSSSEDTGPVGSPGCGMVDPPSGMLTIDVDGQQGEYVVSVPPGYDPNTPYPLGFAFHGRNRTGPQCQAGDCAGFQTAMENEAVLVYMTSMGGTGWEGPEERELNVTFFETVLEQMRTTYCIDESLVFTAGTSSGAHFVNILGCRFGDRLAAIAPVAGVLPETENCVDSVAALVIHGISDYHVQFSAGEEARDFWKTRNNCSDETIPPISEIHTDVMNTPESHGCAAYQGCDAGLPVVWCEHSEGGYDGSTHGWPLFGGQQIWDFVSTL